MYNYFVAIINDFPEMSPKICDQNKLLCFNIFIIEDKNNRIPAFKFNFLILVFKGFTQVLLLSFRNTPRES